MNINKWLKNIIMAGIFVVPFIPWFVSSWTFFPFITGKNFLFRVIIEIIFALWAILALRDKDSRPQKSYLLWSVLTLVLIDGLAAFFGQNPYRSFWSNFERMDGYITILHLGAYFLVLASMFKDKVKWFWLATASLVANIYVALYGFAQLFGWATIHQSGTRLDASLGNSAYLAVYVLFHIFMAGYLLSTQWAKNKLLSAWYIVMILADTIILYYTATRGAILGLVGGVLLACLLLAIFSQGQTRKVSGVIIGIVVLALVGFMAVKNTSFVKQNQVLSRFASISLNDGTTQSRFMIWNMSWQGFKEHPVLGWGPENYPLVFAKYYNPKMWSNEPWFDRSHNIFFDWLINAGALGLLAYLSIYALIIYYLWFKRRDLPLVTKSLFTGLLAAYFFHNIFVFDNLVSYILFFSFIGYIHFLATNGQGQGKELGNKNSNHHNLTENRELLNNVSAVLIGLALIAGLYYVNYKPYEVSTNLIKAIGPASNTPEKSLTFFKDIFAANTFGTGEALEQFVTRTIGTLSSPQVSTEVKQKFGQTSIEEMKKYLTRFPNEARTNLLFGAYLSAAGDSGDGLGLLQKALTESPQKQQILFELVNAYVRVGDATNAVAAAKRAYDLDPNYAEARKVYALVALLTKQSSVAEQLLTPIKNTPDYYNDDRLVSVYQQLGNQGAANEILRERAAATKK